MLQVDTRPERGNDYCSSGTDMPVQSEKRATTRGDHGDLLDLEALRVALEELRDVPNETIVARGHELLANISNPVTLRALLVSVRSSPAALEVTAAQSYRHVNHFDKLVLVGDSDPAGYRLTLHSWAPPYADSAIREETIHEHRFNFWSAILFGTQVSFNYVTDPRGSVYRKYQFCPENRNLHFSEFYEFRGETQLAPHSVDTRHEGNQYYMDAQSIHQVLVPLDSATATLVLRGPRLRPYSYCFNTSYPVQGTSFENAMFSSSQLDAKLADICSHLDGRIERDLRRGNA